MSFYTGKSVLVAGGGGLLGQSLIPKLLAAGAKVRATEHNQTIDSAVRDRIEIWQGNLRGMWSENDEMTSKAATIQRFTFLDLFRDIDIVFWCAAKVGGAKAIRESPSDLIIYNLNMTSNFMNLAAGRVDRFAFVSSSYIYPDTGTSNKEEEGFWSDPPDIHFGLGWIKRYLETLCTHFQLTTKTKFAIIRPTNYFGPWDNYDPDASHVVPALVRKAVEKQDPFEIWGDGTEQRCFTYVDDVAEGLMRTVEKCPENSLAGGPQALNICTRKVNTVEDVALALFKIVGFQPDVKHMLDKPTAIPYKVSDPSKASELLGFNCTTSLRDGLAKTVEWYKKNGEGRRT